MNMVREEQKRAVISDDNTWMYIMQELSAFLVVMLAPGFHYIQELEQGVIVYHTKSNENICSLVQKVLEGEPENLFMISYSN